MVAWWFPPRGRVENFRAGRSRAIVYIFGSWYPIDQLTPQDLRNSHVPDPIVDVDDISECSFNLDSESSIPYETFDALRLHRGVDVTGLATIMAHNGNLYRSYVLLKGNM